MVERIDPSSTSTRASEVEREREYEKERRAVERLSSETTVRSSDRVEISNGNQRPDEVEKASSVSETNQTDREAQELAGSDWYRYGLPSAYEEMES